MICSEAILFFAGRHRTNNVIIAMDEIRDKSQTIWKRAWGGQLWWKKWDSERSIIGGIKPYWKAAIVSKVRARIFN